MEIDAWMNSAIHFAGRMVALLIATESWALVLIQILGKEGSVHSHLWPFKCFAVVVFYAGQTFGKANRVFKKKVCGSFLGGNRE